MNTGVGCHSRLQEIFLTQGSNLDLRHCREILYHLSHQGSLTQLLFAILTPSATERVCVWSRFSLTLCNPRDCISPGFSVHGILQARLFTTWEAPATEYPHVNFPRRASLVAQMVKNPPEPPLPQPPPCPLQCGRSGFNPWICGRW